MKKTNPNRFLSSLFGLALLVICIPARGQQSEPSTLEIGGQFTSLPGAKREVGFGARVTYNLTRNLALEAEGNYLPSASTRGNSPGGSIRQGQFGVKAGRRWDRFGIFLKARPGFVSFDGTFVLRIKTFITGLGGAQIPIYDFNNFIKTTHFSMDLGGVIEAYPSRRVIVRFDAGDTIIHFGPYNNLDFAHTPEFFKSPGFTTHNFQVSSGVSFRLLMPKDESGASTPQTKTAARDSTPRFEVGAHFTSLTFNPPRQVFSFGFPAFTDEDRPQTELGFGGRFTLNLSDSIAIETVFNYFPTADGVSDGATGRVLQGQFGVKAGKRFQRFGLFGKVRPGFVTFTRSFNLVATRPFIFGGHTFLQGIFETGPRTFFANDLGGVVEFYPSRRWSLRIDAGDTIIHYGPRSVSTFFLNPTFITSAPEKRHNFQFSSGFAFRF